MTAGSFFNFRLSEYRRSVSPRLLFKYLRPSRHFTAIQFPLPLDAVVMSPKPDDDLFIEPADDEDVVYGDYNNTMDGASSSGPRPYIRLTSQLRNATRNAGGEVRFRCEAVGTPPLNFSWLKNNAPVEKSRRLKVRTKENSSRLVISELDVLDSGYYQCIASNTAASVNSTSVLRVNNVPDSGLKSRKGGKTQSIEDYEDYELMDRGRLPDEEDSDLYRVPNNAAGHGYIPSGTNERWLDGVKFKYGECISYRGEACRQYLSGRHIMLTSENREDMYDIDRNIKAAMIFLHNFPNVSQQCRQISQAVACFHMYKVCDPTSPTGSKQPLAICKKDCDRIQKDVCPQEMELAAQHELVGDGPKALFPSCPALPQSSHCIPVLESELPTSSELPKPHWCYTNTGTTYEGAVSTTISGKTCMKWEDSSSREFNVHRYPDLRKARNQCRNPGGKKTRPWCFSQPMGQEEYCDVQPCPKELYPANERPRDNGISATDSVANMWDSLTPQWQYGALIGGVSIFILLIFFVCCLCCCRAKKKKGKSRSGANNHMSAPPSIVNSNANSAYYRKLNGNSTPIVGRGGGPMEMAHLLPNQMGIPPPYPDQFRQQEIMEDPYHVRNIAPSQLQRGQLIGEGQFGMVHSGLWSGAMINGEPMQVAIKSVRIDPTNADRASLEEEVRTVAAFDHPHLVKLLGVCYWNSQMSAVFEFMVHGDLYEFLRLRDPGNHVDSMINDNEEFMRIATQIAYGMEYLASMSFVHRDLATRNCLVWDNHMIKIPTFPLMKDCHREDYYRMPHRSWMPVRWMSKENLEQGSFTEASDVWSFGVTLWEIWSYGRQPYEGNTPQQVIEYIANRNLLECPQNCPTKIYSLMVECWHENPDRRPTFQELHGRLQAWSVASPAHSILNPARNSNSSQSGSSMSGRGPQKPLGVSSTRQPYNPRGGRRLEDASPLMRREGNYQYSEDDVESD